MMIFPITEFMDEQKCYDYLVTILHPNGLVCPRCAMPVQRSFVHRWDRAPVLYYRCSCGRVFNAFSGTCWQGVHHACSIILMILQGISKGTPTKHLAAELHLDPKHLLERRHTIQAEALKHCPTSPLPDSTVEADEMYQNAGEKGKLHEDPDDPPRCRANKAKGHGTWDTDRPPIQGIVGRESGRVRLKVLHNSAWRDLAPLLMGTTLPGTTVNTDDWGAYGNLSKHGRIHVTVCHKPGKREWARDDDGDGIRESHSNTIEGVWTGLRNFLRPFRGVSKYYLSQYTAIHEWACNLREVTLDFLRMLCGVTPCVT